MVFASNARSFTAHLNVANHLNTALTATKLKVFFVMSAVAIQKSASIVINLHSVHGE
jgi:hypothetical protein